MKSKPDLAAQIEEIRSRTGPSEWDNGITKLLYLVDQTKRLEEECEENAYFLIASVSAMETYFRWEIQRLIDSEEPRYLNNLKLNDSSLRIGHELLIAVHGQRVSIGELVAHSQRLHSLDAIVGIMKELLDADFLALIKEAREPEMSRNVGPGAPIIIRSIGDTLTAVKRAFELRHIFCHEAHLNMVLKGDEVRGLCSACYSFVLASHYAIAFHRNPRAPLTLQEAHEAAMERVRLLEESINDVQEKMISTMGSRERERFLQIGPAWKEYVEREADFNASLNMNGNRGELDTQLTRECFYKKRLLDLKEHARRIDASPWKP